VYTHANDELQKVNFLFKLRS